MKASFKGTQGQAVIEYILMLAIALTITTLFTVGFKSFVNGFWKQMTCEVTAACPGCPADPEIDNRMPGPPCKVAGH